MNSYSKSNFLLLGFIYLLYDFYDFFLLDEEFIILLTLVFAFIVIKSLIGQALSDYLLFKFSVIFKKLNQFFDLKEETNLSIQLVLYGNLNLLLICFKKILNVFSVSKKKLNFFKTSFDSKMYKMYYIDFIVFLFLLCKNNFIRFKLQKTISFLLETFTKKISFNHKKLNFFFFQQINKIKGSFFLNKINLLVSVL